MLGLFLAMALAQLQLSQLRSFWLYRYEAYVIALGIVAVAVAAWSVVSDTLRARTETSRAFAAAVLLVLVAASPLTHRVLVSTATVPVATANIYEQQYQMGRFLGRYRQGPAHRRVLAELRARDPLKAVDAVLFHGK